MGHQPLVGQGVSDPIDSGHGEVLPHRVWDGGDPDGVTQRAIDEVKQTAAVGRAVGVNAATGLLGLPVSPLLYLVPHTPDPMIDEGYEQFTDQWTSILDVFADNGIQFALEVQPIQLALDLSTA